MEFPVEFFETERGNIWLFDEYGNHKIWIDLTGFWNKQLVISIAPGNYPGLLVSIGQKTPEDLAKTINNLEGWKVRKCNLDGVKMYKDEEGIWIGEEE